MRALVCTLSLTLSALFGCGGTPTPAAGDPQASSESDSSAEDTLPTLDRAALMRLIEASGILPCGLESATQREALPVQSWSLTEGSTLVQLECFFFGLQGVYEYWLVKRDMKARALSFSDAEPLQLPVAGRPPQERRSPATKEGTREMLCGRPQYDAGQEHLSSACLGQGGRCGVYSRYQLDTTEGRFEATERRYQPCSAASDQAPSEWPALP